MKTKVLLIAIVKKGNSILLRKKPDGFPPYKETWYLFGGENNPDKTIEEILNEHMQQQAGIDVIVKETIGWDTEVKKDHDGEIKQFIYLDTICEYKNGKLTPTKGIEKLEWVDVDDLHKYDLVPPSVKLFEKLGYLK